MSGRKVFTAGEVLQAADVNDFLMDQSVMVFAGTAARGSAIPSPTEGMVTYLADSDEVEVYTTSWGSIGGGKILQVVSTTKTDTFSTASASFTAVTNLSATITPSSTSSKIFVLATVTGNGTPAVTVMHLRLVRGATPIFVGTTAGNRISSGATSLGTIGQSIMSFVVSGLDTPASVSAQTYGVEVRNQGSGTVFINRSSDDADSALYARTVSTITVMEVAD